MPSDGSVCYECQNVAHPMYCNWITTCGPHEVCSVQQMVTTSGTIYYKSGCMDNLFCSETGSRKRRNKGTYRRGNSDTKSYKRRNSDVVFCTECCKTDFCNNNLCDRSFVETLDNVRCLHCDAVDKPSDCKQVQMCGQDEVCYTERLDGSTGILGFKLGCRKKMNCQALASLVGRDVDKRLLYGYNCNQCCFTENCNGQLCSNVTYPESTQSSTSTTMTTSNYHPEFSNICYDKGLHCNDIGGLCDDQYVADNICPRTCGRCTTPPSTTATCLDQTTDCQYLNEHFHICTDTEAINHLGCHKTCNRCNSVGGVYLVTTTPTVVATPVQATVALKCKTGYVRYGMSCYLFPTQKTSWFQANSSCAGSGYLAEVTSQSENDFIIHHAQTELWIGAKRYNTGNFHWSRTNQHLTWTNWSPGEPDNRDGIEDCVEIWGPQNNGKWNDGNCYTPLNYVCESRLSL